jgi:hypothetical protein
MPSEIGEFVSPLKEESGDAYPFGSDPNGKYYHFVSFASLGDTQWDGIVYEEKFTATSTLAPSGSTRYEAENLRNDKPENEGSGNRSVAWCEGVKGYGIGERINMSVRTMAIYESCEDEIRIWSVMIVNGYAKNATTWKNNSRVKILRLHVGGVHWCDLHLADVIKPQVFKFPEGSKIYPIKSGKKVSKEGKFAQPSDYDLDNWPTAPVRQTDLTFEIIEVYPGDKYDDTCITGIAIDIYAGIY